MLEVTVYNGLAGIGGPWSGEIKWHLAKLRTTAIVLKVLRLPSTLNKRLASTDVLVRYMQMIFRSKWLASNKLSRTQSYNAKFITPAGLLYCTVTIIPGFLLSFSLGVETFQMQLNAAPRYLPNQLEYDFFAARQISNRATKFQKNLSSLPFVAPDVGRWSAENQRRDMIQKICDWREWRQARRKREANALRGDSKMALRRRIYFWCIPVKRTERSRQPNVQTMFR